MELYWTHNQADKTLKTIIFNNDYNQELYYTTEDGGQVIKKYFNDNLVTSFVRTDKEDPWEEEKVWIGATYPEQVKGSYEPMWYLQELSEEEYKEWENTRDWDMSMPLYGISEDGFYLDRLQRHSHVQEGRDMENVVIDLDNKLWIEKDSEGNYYQREWCEENNSFYNVQPCCVFPTNPGRTLLKDYSEE